MKMKIKKEEFDDDKCSVVFPLVSISKTKVFVLVMMMCDVFIRLN